MKTIYYILFSMRPKQWAKNLILFAGIVFSRLFHQPDLVRLSLLGFVVFCLLSGAVYLLNDVVDRRRDLGHPVKMRRPVARGALAPGVAAAAAVALAAAAVALSSGLGRPFFMLSGAFLALNLAYTFALRAVVILDVIAISFSFLIRAVAGVVVLQPRVPGIEFSPWLWICTLFLALFLAVCKRRHEFCRLEEAAHEHRSSLKDYSAQLLDQLVGLTGTAAIVSYSIYTVWPSTVEKFGTHDLVYTLPFVVFGIMRYLYLVYSRHGGGDPTSVLLTEKSIMINVFLWFAAVVFVIAR